MARRNTKADLILREARERMEKASINAHEAANHLNQLRAVENAYTDAYFALERALTHPKPSASTAKKAPRKSPEPLLKEASKEPICDICGNHDGYQDHHHPSPNYHAFESGKKKASAA
jgi:hypothetical protein